MSMKRVTELLSKWSLREQVYSGLGDEFAGQAEMVAMLSGELKAAVAPDWKPASEPPDDDREVWFTIGKSPPLRGHYGRFTKLWFVSGSDRNCCYAATHWHEIEVPEPPEVGT